MVNSMPKIPVYETGIAPLDYELGGGIEIGTFVQVVGESGAGKSHLMIEILANITRYKEAGFFSFEMGMRRTKHRIERVCENAEHLKNWLIEFDDRHIDSVVRDIKIMIRKGIKFILIDSMMKIDSDYKFQSAVKHQEHVSDVLAKICQQHDVIILLINQKSKSDTQGGHDAIAGAIAQVYDADIVLQYKKNERLPLQRRLVCTKNRTGDERLFSIDLKLDKNGKTVSVDHFGEIEVAYENISMPAVL